MISSSAKNNSPAAVVNAVTPEAASTADVVTDERMNIESEIISDPKIIQRKCDECQAQEEEEEVRRKPVDSFIQKKVNSGGGTVSEGVNSNIAASRGKANGMDHSTKSFMESRFGTDFTNVHIHTDDNAVQLSRELNAKAFTVGNDIYFNEGQYRPGADDGKRLLAHELAHTIQQSSNTINLKIQRLQLTYDDGPDANTQTTLTAVKAGGATATFYLVGQKIQQADNWKIVFDIAASGNWLGNHAFDWDTVKDDHIFLSGDFSERASKILQTEFAIRDALIKGKKDAQANKKWDLIPEANRNYIDDVISTGTGRFRTPGFRSHFYSPGASQQRQAIEVLNKILSDAGLRTLEVSDSVSVDPKDWQKGKTQADIEKAVTGGATSDSDSILLHSRLATSAAATPAILSDIKSKGFSYQAPSRGTTSGSTGSGFGGIKASADWINTYSYLSKIGPAITQNRTDPVDRTVTDQTGVAWIDYGSGAYLAIIHITNSSIGGGTTILFYAFVEKDLKTKALALATPNQPRGIQTIDKKYIIDAPSSPLASAAKK